MILVGQTMGAIAQSWPVSSVMTKPGTRWWWMGSAVDSVNLRWNLAQLYKAGIGTVEITPIYGIQGNEKNELRYLSAEWMRALRATEAIAKEKGMQIDLNNGTGWPFGGPWVPKNEAACKAVFHDTVIDGRRKVMVEVGRTGQKVKRAAPGGEGLVIDHFDKSAVKNYLNHIDSAFKTSGTPYPATFFNDSYEVYGADWTPALPTEFKKRRGYDLLMVLDKLVDGDPQIVSDYRETLSDMLLENFTHQWVDWAHKKGVKVRNQAHGSPANLIDLYAEVDIPETEGFGLSDFGIKGLRTDSRFTRKNDSDISMLKYASSAAHITGKPLTSSETFTWLTEHFRTSLSQMKPDLDLMFTCGVNRMFFHGTTYSPKDEAWPGWKFYASVDMSPTNSIWRDASALMTYIDRCQRFLQMGQSDNDFLVYLPIKDFWKRDTKNLLMQFDIHSMAKKAPDFIKTVLEIDSLGYDCDYISDRYLLSTQYVGGELQTASGTRYKALIIPEGANIDTRLRQHLNDLKLRGANIMGLDPERMALVAHPEQMRLEGIRTIRRRNVTGWHYFMANLSPHDIRKPITLAVPFKDAYWFDPMNGDIKRAEIVHGKVIIDLRSGRSFILQTYNSLLAPLKKRKAKRNGCEKVLLNGPWTLNFTESTPKVARTFKMKSPHTWETLNDTSVKALMGTGCYTTYIYLDKAKAKKHWQIELGDVRESARVYINDKPIGVAWAVPFVLDCKDALKEGYNKISIEVTNLPANRIADMDRKGVKWRKMKEINIVNLEYKKTTYANWSPVPSGLTSTPFLCETNN